jgi:hypothetical protein
MPKTSKITFNVNDLQRQHTGQKRCYDNVKRKFKVTFIAGTVTLYVDNVIVSTGTSVITDYILSRSLIQFLIFASIGSGYYDDLIIHRL